MNKKKEDVNEVSSGFYFVELEKSKAEKIMVSIWSKVKIVFCKIN